MSRIFCPAVLADKDWASSWDRPEVQLDAWQRWRAGDAEALLPLLEVLSQKFGPFWPGCGRAPSARTPSGVPQGRAEEFDDFALLLILRWFETYDPERNVPVVAWVGINARRYLLARWHQHAARARRNDPFHGHVDHLEDLSVRRQRPWDEWLV